MHRHNFDLIAEYAQGSLPDDSRARALVDSCDVCREIYAEQKLAIESLAAAASEGVSSATMTEHEKAALHRDLWTELRSPARTEAAPTSWWRTSWAIGTATVIVLGVGLVGVLSNVGSSGSTAENFSEVGAPIGRGLSGSNADGSDSGNPAAETTSTAAALDLAEDLAVEKITSEIRATAGFTSTYYEEPLPEETTSEEDCLERAGLINFFTIHDFDDITNLIVALPEDRSLSDTPIVFVDPENCTIVHMED
jgi:hypothetical protein